MAQITNIVYFGDNLPILRRMSANSVELAYVDPPFNTGGTQRRVRLKTSQAEDGDRRGFKGKRYKTERVGTAAFADRFDDYVAFLEPRLREAYRVLSPAGSFYLHLD